MQRDSTPIALFTYNRPEPTTRLFDSLARNDRLDECQLYVYCDGAKKPEHAAGVEANRHVVKQWAERLGATVIERSENLGLARSIVTGVTELCTQYGRVIVLEDDLILSPDFLTYMLNALHRYQDEPTVYQISGYMFPVKHPAKPDAFFLPLTTTWGWATWDRAWRSFDWQASGAQERLAAPDFRRRFDLNGSYPYSVLLEQRLAGKNESWGILWWYSVFCRNGLVLYPRQSLVQNYGFDGSGTHGRNTAFRVQRTAAQLTNPLLFPARLAVDVKAFERIQTYLRRTVRPRQPATKLTTLFTHVWQWLKQ